MSEAFWETLEDFAGGRALQVTWRSRMAAAYGWIQPCLIPAPYLAASYPCTRVPPCGCDHAVREDPEWGLSTVCICGDGGCDAIPLQVSDAVVYTLDWFRLCQAIGRAFPGLSVTRVVDLEVGSRCLYLATNGPVNAPVCFCCPPDETNFLALIGRLARNLERPFIVLTPTDRHFSSEIEIALRRESSTAISLAGRLEWRADCPGEFQWRGSIDHLLAEWTARISHRGDTGRILRSIHRQLAFTRKSFVDLRQRAEPLSDDVARQVFAVIKQLEQSPSTRKAPLVQVFRLYCLENLSAEEVARECGCSKALIVLRMKELERRLGRKPSQLRGISSQFEQMEESLSDPRARRIRRSEAMDGEELEG